MGSIEMMNRTGRDLLVGNVMEQWGALWAVVERQDSTDDDVWLDLLWLGGSTDEGARTCVFYGNNEPVKVAILKL